MFFTPAFCVFECFANIKPVVPGYYRELYCVHITYNTHFTIMYIRAYITKLTTKS